MMAAIEVVFGDDAKGARSVARFFNHFLAFQPLSRVF